MEHKSPLLKCELCLATSKVYSMKKEGTSNFAVETLNNYYLSQVIKANLNSHKWC